MSSSQTEGSEHIFRVHEAALPAAGQQHENDMFEALLASAPPHVVKPGRLLGSLLTHVLTIGLVADWTRGASDDARLFGAATSVLVLVRPVPFSVPPPKKPLKTRAPSRP